MSYEEDDEDDNSRFRALVQRVTAKNAPLQQQHPQIDDGGESSEEEGGADVVVNSEGIPIPRMVVRKRVGAEGFSKPEVNEEAIDAIVEASLVQKARALQEVATDEEDEEEDEDDEEDEDVSTDNEDDDSNSQQQSKERDRQLQREAEKVIRQQRLTSQFVSGGSGNQSLVEVHDVEDDDEDEEDDDEDEEEEEMEEVKEDESASVGKVSGFLSPF